MSGEWRRTRWRVKQKAVAPRPLKEEGGDRGLRVQCEGRSSVDSPRVGAVCAGGMPTQTSLVASFTYRPPPK